MKRKMIKRKENKAEKKQEKAKLSSPKPPSSKPPSSKPPSSKPPPPAQSIKRTGKNRAYDNMPLFIPSLRIRINGFNQSRIINALNSELIGLKDIKRASMQILEITVHKKDSKKTFAILDKMCYDYSVIAESGFHTLLAACLKHTGLLIGAAVFTALLVFMSRLVWRIEISGNEAVDSVLISRALSDNGIRVGRLKGKLDLDAVTASLRNMAGIAEGTIEIKGTTVYVNVLEEKSYVAPSGEKDYTDIVSAHDAEITRMTVRSGTTDLKIGDRVARGQTLVRAERLDSNGESMGQVQAEGSVYGIVAFKETHIFSLTEQILSRTGKKKTYTTLSLFGLNIGKKPPHKKGEDSITTAKKLFFIPIRVTRTVCYQTEIIERERDIDAYTESLKEEAILNNVIKANGAEIETVVTRTMLDGDLIMLNIYIQAEVLLGEG